MNPPEAQRAIESLRKGIPPSGFVRYFTVGRESEIKSLTARLDGNGCGALLIKANYGSGKTHLLRFVREDALDRGYAVCSVTLDAKSAVRFNRMDQILGAIWRGLELPGESSDRGTRALFSLIQCQIEESKAEKNRKGYWSRLTNEWRWDFSEVLESPAMFIALRAWSCGKPEVQDLVADWITQPWVYYARRRFLYQELVEKLRKHFRDPRPEWQFYNTNAGIFNFQMQDYDQSWKALRDLQALSQAAGLRGVVILFDEFEDVLNNLKRVDYQEAAFWNLFRFYSGKQFPGMTFFAVTPEFAAKCKRLLMDKGRWDFDYSRFQALPTFEMSPLEKRHLEDLAMKIMETHGIAYGWEPDTVMKASDLKRIISASMSVRVEDRVRQTIKEIVKALDHLLESTDE